MGLKGREKDKLKLKKVIGTRLIIGEILIFLVLFFLILIQNQTSQNRQVVSKTKSHSFNFAKVTYAVTPSLSPKPAQADKIVKITLTSPAAPASANNIIAGLKTLSVPILMYHYIGNNPNPKDTARNTLSTAPDVFDQQLGYLQKNGYTPITLDTLYAAMKGGLLPNKPVIISVDDGYIDFYVNAFPILKKYNFHAISFIPTSLMNQGYYMSWSQIKEIAASGLVAFEAHSLTHPDLTSLSPSEEMDQITQSKKILEEETGAPVNFFAYPYGTSNSLSQEDVKEAGYFGAVGTWLGYSEGGSDIFNMPRVRINGGITLSEFATLL